MRQVAPNGAITTVAGNGIAGYSGDGGSAVNAQVGNPVAVAADAAGNVYIADGSARVRKVFLSGLIHHHRRQRAKDIGRWRQSRRTPAERAFGAGSRMPPAASGWPIRSTTRCASCSSHRRGTTVSAVTNGASNLSGPVAPGEVLVIYGSGLGPAQLAQYQADSNGQGADHRGRHQRLLQWRPRRRCCTPGRTRWRRSCPSASADRSPSCTCRIRTLTSAPFNLSVASQIPAIFTLRFGYRAGGGDQQQRRLDQRRGAPGQGRRLRPALYYGRGQTNPPGTDGLINAGTLPVPVAP